MLHLMQWHPDIFKCNLCVQMLFLGHSMSTHISVTAAVVIVSLAAVVLLQTAFLSHTGTYRQLQLWFSLFNTFTVSLLVTRVKRLSSVLSWNGKCSQSGHCFSENNSLESTVSVETPNIRETIFRYLKNNFFVPYNQRLFCVIWSHLARHLAASVNYLFRRQVRHRPVSVWAMLRLWARMELLGRALI